MRRHLTYANVMATIGVFLALGGGAYAAAKLPGNSVGAKQIKTGAVGSTEVKNRSLKAGDFKGGLPQGPRGPAGAPAVKHWAKISSGTTRTVLASSGQVTVTRTAANGLVKVTFPEDVSKCAISLTILGGAAGRTIRVVTSETAGSTVAVWTTYVSGAVATTTDDAFDIAAAC